MRASAWSSLIASAFLEVLLSSCAPTSTPAPLATATSIPTPTPWSLVVVGDSIALNSSMVCETAQENGFSCADIYHTFNGTDGLSLAGDLLAKDYTHPSDKGNEVIAWVLADLGYAPLVP